MCGLNRVRAMPQRPGVVAAWGEDGRVQVRRHRVPSKAIFGLVSFASHCWDVGKMARIALSIRAGSRMQQLLLMWIHPDSGCMQVWDLVQQLQQLAAIPEDSADSQQRVHAKAAHRSVG